MKLIFSKKSSKAGLKMVKESSELNGNQDNEPGNQTVCSLMKCLKTSTDNIL